MICQILFLGPVRYTHVPANRIRFRLPENIFEGPTFRLDLHSEETMVRAYGCYKGLIHWNLLQTRWLRATLIWSSCTESTKPFKIKGQTDKVRLPYSMIIWSYTRQKSSKLSFWILNGTLCTFHIQTLDRRIFTLPVHWALAFAALPSIRINWK